MVNAILLGNLAATLALTGLIWAVQVAHYPLFARVGEPAWRSYHDAHMRAITWVVAPLMALELLTALALLAVRPAGVGVATVWVGAALVVVLWGVTGVVQVPQHEVLRVRHDVATIQQLVRWNWVRTAGWTVRAALLLAATASLL